MQKKISNSNKKKSSKPFSLVPEAHQQEIHKLLQEAQRLISKLPPSDHPSSYVAEIACSLALRSGDPVIALPTSLGARLVKDGAKSALAAYKKGRFDFPLPERPADSEVPILATMTGIAVAELATKDKGLALVCCPPLDKAGDWRSTFRFVGQCKIPILYVVPSSGGTKRGMDLRTLHAEYGIPVIQVDGADAIASYRVTTEAIHNARVGHGATVLESITITGRNPGRESVDPVEILESYMRRHGTLI